MMIFQLLRSPQATISRLVETPEHKWRIPMTGFFFVSFAEGYGRIAEKNPTWTTVSIILLTAAGALVIGTWAWAGVFGGALHLSSRLLKGKEQPSRTIRAVGYAFFWPGAVAVVASIAAMALGYRGGELPTLALPALLVHVGAGIWALYAAVAALRVTHGFTWGRAIAAYVLPFAVLVLVVAAVALLLSWPPD